MKILSYHKSHDLYLENVNLSDLCNKHVTPFYVYSSTDIKQNCTQVLEIGKNHKLTSCYALKANYNPALLKIIIEKGFGIDVVSGGELYFALRSGVSPDKIVFAGVGKTEDEIEYAIKEDIHSLNVESESELYSVNKIAQKLQKKIRIAFRVNPDIDPQTHPYISTGLHYNKFGVGKDLALELFQKSLSMNWIVAEGLHVHIGSQIASADPYLETAEFLENMVNELAKIGINITYLDLGGGIGINYENQIDEDGNQRTYIKTILPKILEKLRKLDLSIFVELGRSIIGSAGFLITKVIHIKETQNKKFIVVDAAMNNLVRPSLYQAYHQILPLKWSNSNQTEKVDVVGPVCETGDFLAKDRELPIIRQGDYLAITGAGAYGQSLSSNYNLRPQIAELLVNENKVEIIKERQKIEEIAEQYNWE